MTYLEILLWFVVPPTVVFAALAHRVRHQLGTRARWVIPGVAVAALVYTTPWDNYLVWSGIWWYGEGRVLGTLGWVPVEEYAFFLLQPLLTGSLYLWLLARLFPELLECETLGPARGPILPGVAFLGVGVAALPLLFRDPTLYSALILVWTCPVLGAMWLLGGRWLTRLLAPALLAAVLSSLYLWVVDWWAIRTGVWTIAEAYTTGVTLNGLPMEEALFFVLTNLLVVWGVTLFLVPGLSDSGNGLYQPRTGRPRD